MIHTMFCQVYNEEVLSKLDEEGALASVDDIRSDQSLCGMVQQMMVDEDGTSIYHIVEQFIIHYGKVYPRMKAFN